MPKLTYCEKLSAIINDTMFHRLYHSHKIILKYFDTEIIKHLKKFNSKNEIAIRNNAERVEFLFDSLFNTYLKDTYIRNIELKNAKSGKINLDKIDNLFYY